MPSIRNAISELRFSDAEGDPKLLKNYLGAVSSVATVLPDERDKFLVYFRALELLMEVIFDCCVDQQWRWHCLDNLYQPLLKAEHYAKHQADRIALAKLKMTMHKLVPYFL